MAEQHITPSSHSALTRESSGSSPSRAVGGRSLRQSSHSLRSRRNATSPLPRSTSRHASRQTDPEPHTLRRSSRLINSLPRSDYSISERWSYGTDVYETRCDTTHLKGGDSHNSSGGHTKRGRTSSHDRKRRKTRTSESKESVAYCTRSRTALKLTESASEQNLPTTSQTVTEPPANQNAAQNNQSEGGLLPLDERDYAYSPYSSSPVIEFVDSDHSVYSPTASKRKGKKRKRSEHRSLSSRKSSGLLIGGSKKKYKRLDSPKKESAEATDVSSCKTNKQETEREPQASCSYSLRNRELRSAPLASTVISDSSDTYNKLLITPNYNMLINDNYGNPVSGVLDAL
ncbi:Uncharacterized protein OBRU01_15014 [Operophtera brumata]|uniref:Uncharacterized protein n=1 Tax=Operophtera brumata TaxID=104452 RepID=A0A0L7L5H9_OPEBR|nr:Uncharacterized protein OBRU01_15014 [Operophtera brumata]